jgi:glycosyltransferase involved in cell wall biosynthesis
VVGGATVSVIATVFNEASNVEEWLAALLNQTLSPDEIVIVDGGSRDGTIGIIRRCATDSPICVIVIEAPGANISQGRNIAIERASGQFIAVTDAGTRADPTWLEHLVAPLIAGDADVASGFFVPRLASRWERALAATTLPDAAEIDPRSFLPSSRSMAFRRAWFEAGMRYPEWLDYCEDLVWDFAMLRAGARFTFAPDAKVNFSVRPSVRSYAVQYVRYARGDGKAGLFARRHVLRYLTYAGLSVVLMRRSMPEMLLTAVLGSGYLAKPVRRLWCRDRSMGRAASESLGLVPLVVVLRAIGDVAKMAGYPAGLAWRWRRFGRLGWRTTWRRVSPAGALFRPAAMTRESQPPGGSLGVEFPVESR